MTDTEPVADTVRRAAKLLREHAIRAANEAEGDTLMCWETEKIAGQERVIEIRQYPDGTAHDVVAVPTTGGVAEYIAAMHPAVALAVADSWDHQADDMADHEAYESGVGGMLRPVVRTEDHGTHHDWTATLAAARALLGEVQP